MNPRRLWRPLGRGRDKRIGRHALGRPYIAVEPGESREPDLADRAAAVLLDRMEPGWTIMYGPWSRRFYALALYPTPEPLVVEARTAQDLLTEMRQAERDLAFRPQATVTQAFTPTA
ncbi:hypothetical protein Sme01_44510 [Sphaerisporangium melleum]|uniref:Uncharacterized protein n=1 Tax=Sphaerisporangium melleum TaxID=321316 RepID=A0A917R1G3_9ACTN|nr:hypothetical protein [Sphaerisporangium melleum]GGK81015.1 hypothetical protein GCM10007964_24600 [Sphaerisporangium melleum]GII71975.1 hypothetical protein Sme01_44510 [Sphaerisporangium melleum]